mgnify:CR=1 FL=1
MSKRKTDFGYGCEDMDWGEFEKLQLNRKNSKYRQYNRKIRVVNQSIIIGNKTFSINQLTYFISFCVDELVGNKYKGNKFICEKYNETNGNLIIYDFISLFNKSTNPEDFILLRMVDFMTDKSILQYNSWVIKNRENNKYFNNELYDKYFGEGVDTEKYKEEFVDYVEEFGWRKFGMEREALSRMWGYYIKKCGFSKRDCFTIFYKLSSYVKVVKVMRDDDDKDKIDNLKSIYNTKNKMNIKDFKQLLLNIGYERRYEKYMETETEEKPIEDCVECLID